MHPNNLLTKISMFTLLTFLESTENTVFWGTMGGSTRAFPYRSDKRTELG